MIKELIVVEGKNDAELVRRAYPQADVMITHGWGLSKAQVKALQTAHRRRGIIVFTDPDHGGQLIRRRLSKLLPGCHHAFIPREKAIKGGKVGVEAATVNDVVKALSQVRSEAEAPRDVFQMEDLVNAGLTGVPDAARRRRQVGDILGIGYGNSKSFLWRLNALGVTQQEFRQAVHQLEDDGNGYDQPPKYK